VYKPQFFTFILYNSAILFGMEKHRMVTGQHTDGTECMNVTDRQTYKQKCTFTSNVTTGTSNISQGTLAGDNSNATACVRGSSNVTRDVRSLALTNIQFKQFNSRSI